MFMVDVSKKDQATSMSHVLMFMVDVSKEKRTVSKRKELRYVPMLCF